MGRTPRGACRRCGRRSRPAATSLGARKLSLVQTWQRVEQVVVNSRHVTSLLICANSIADKFGVWSRSTEKSWPHFRPSAVDFCGSRLAIGRCNRTRASVGNAGGNARPSLTNATLAADFRSDIDAFLDDDLIDAAIDHGRP